MGLPEGTRVKVVDDRSRRYPGTFEEVDGEALLVRQHLRPVTLRREEVTSVSVHEFTGTTKRAAILAGAIKGALVGLAAIAPFIKGVNPSGDRALEAAGALLGGVLGAANGAQKQARARYRDRVVYVHQ